MQKLRLLSLFAGIGGFELGLERSGGFETVAQCEIDPFCRRVLAKHWPNVRRYEDVRELTAARLVADGIAVDAICGGFPCQDISVAGNGAGLGEGTRSGLWGEFARLIGEIRPQVVFVENVANLLVGPSERRGGWFGRVLGDLAKLGYDAEWENIPASAVGAPHRRERVWIVCYPSEARSKQYEALGVYAKMELRDGFDCQNGIVADATSVRQSKSGRPQQSVNSAARSYWKANQPFYEIRWPSVPPVRGTNDGIFRKLDEPRIAALGNAVVPQIPELLGRAYLAAISEQA